MQKHFEPGKRNRIERGSVRRVLSRPLSPPTPGSPPAPTNRNRFPRRRSWPSSPQNGRCLAWWPPGIPWRGSRPSASTARFRMCRSLSEKQERTLTLSMRPWYWSARWDTAAAGCERIAFAEYPHFRQRKGRDTLLHAFQQIHRCARVSRYQPCSVFIRLGSC